jgi:hypothetical protein
MAAARLSRFQTRILSRALVDSRSTYGGTSSRHGEIVGA